MSRSGYVDDIDDWLAYGRWRGTVQSAIRGRRGQQMLRELRDALDAMPEKKLVANSFEVEGAFCTLGVLGHAKGVAMGDLGSDEHVDADVVGERFGIAAPLAQEIMFMNDEAAWEAETQEQRWARMRAWIDSLIKPGQVQC